MIKLGPVAIRGEMGLHFDSVFVNGNRLDPGPSQAIYNHSPDGFAWGYAGSGPSQLALAILFDVTGDRVFALRNYQEFKRRFIATLPFMKNFEITVDLTEFAVEKVEFKWSTLHGRCYECGLPAAFYLRASDTGAVEDYQKLCAVCAADLAADGETIGRIPEVERC